MKSCRVKNITRMDAKDINLLTLIYDVTSAFESRSLTMRSSKIVHDMMSKWDLMTHARYDEKSKTEKNHVIFNNKLKE